MYCNKVVSERDDLKESLLLPDHLYRASDVLNRPCAVPANPGVYVWYFNRVPGFIRADECHKISDYALEVGQQG